MNLAYYDLIVIGAGAAGLMAATHAASRGKRTLLLEHTDKVGEKIRISGGGRCNFTNMHTTHKNYLSENPHFCKSALARYTQWDFIDLVKSHHIPFHEKTLGQLFCDRSATDLIQMFIDRMQSYHVVFLKNTQVYQVTHNGHFEVQTSQGDFQSSSLIVATGGLTVPKIGATDFGYRLAEQFGLSIIPTRPALVPLVVQDSSREFFEKNTGISQDSLVSYEGTSFRENILFTHLGLSGPAILQISSYLPDTQSRTLSINLCPDLSLEEELMLRKQRKQQVNSVLKEFLPQRFLQYVTEQEPLMQKTMVDLSKKEIVYLSKMFHSFDAVITGTTGYNKAEVTIGGIDTAGLSSKNMGALKLPSLHFIGEVVDVTGWLGGYNFQWAWSSAVAAAEAVS